MYSKVIQLYIYICLFFFKFFSHIGYYKILSIAPCAIQQVLVVYLYIVVCICYSQIPNLSLPPPFPLGNRKFVFYVYDSVSVLFICIIVSWSNSCSSKIILEPTVEWMPFSSPRIQNQMAEGHIEKLPVAHFYSYRFIFLMYRFLDTLIIQNISAPGIIETSRPRKCEWEMDNLTKSFLFHMWIRLNNTVVLIQAMSPNS